jgi:hypothetical protein
MPRERSTQRVRLVHWNEAEAEERAGWLRSDGFDVDYEPLTPARLRQMGEDPPDAVVIDLGRLPAQGRDLGLQLRTRAGTRRVPLVFVGGRPDKVERVRELLPDAAYTTWAEIGAVLETLELLEEPVVPDSVFAAYAGTPLAKKLGIKAGATVALVGAPEDFETTLGDLPPEAKVRRTLASPGRQGQPDLALWFTRSLAELHTGLGEMAAGMGTGKLWILWPKKASGVLSDLSQNEVRQAGLAAGLVDFKICSVDAVWSGLCFTRRKGEST